jgi:hypothetical protein
MKHFLRQNRFKSLLILVTLIVNTSINCAIAQWTTVEKIDFNNLTYESDYATLGIPYYDNSTSPTTANPNAGPRNGMINGTWEVANTNLGATQVPGNAAGGRFLMFWTDDRYTYPGLADNIAPTGIVFSKTYNNLVVGTTYRFSYSSGYLRSGSETAGFNNNPLLTLLIDNVVAPITPASLTASWVQSPYLTFTATKTSYTLAISNARNQATGNDFGLDNILLEAQAPLSVSLLSFKANQFQSQINLFWSTANEKDFSHFEVQKSTNAKEFGTINNIKGNKSANYNCIDNTLNEGLNYYRLKMVDLDGTYTYSKIISISYESNGSYIAVENPAKNGILNINTNLKNPKFILVSIDGRQVELNIFKQENAIKLCTKNLKMGLYFLNIIAEGKSISRKIIIE